MNQLAVPFEFPEEYIPDDKGSGKAVYKDIGSRVAVRFIREYIHDEEEILKTGKEAPRERILIQKRAKGDTNIISQIATEEDKKIFSKQWKKFLERDTDTGMEFPLTQLYNIKPKHIAQCAYFGIYTIPELRDADHETLDQIDDGEKLRALAEVWMKTRADQEESASSIILVETYKKRTEEQEEALQSKDEEIAALKALLEKAQEKPKRAPRGRPAKKATAKKKTSSRKKASEVKETESPKEDDNVE